MTQELTQKRPIAFDGVRTLATRVSWQRLALAAILILSAFLNLFRLTNQGYGNTYYAATVKDMLTGWRNFFFASFDAGFVSVDKPPLGFWIQAASAELFGFHGWSLLLPQALAGVLSVGLVYYLVRRAFGPVAGLIAALALALTPISVATARNNDVDSLLVLAVLLAAWALILAVETGRLRWLLMCALVVGLGFNIKMTEVFLVLPAFYLLYLLAAPVSWWRRFVHLGLATVVLLAVSLSWAMTADSMPADQRPYVGSSSNNTTLNLIVGWNGLSRLPIDRLPGGSDLLAKVGAPNRGAAHQPSGSQESSWMSYGRGHEIGAPGPLRLLNEQLAGQMGWLLPLAAVGLLAASWQKRPRLPLVDRRHQALLLWGTWFLTQAAFFSVAGRFGRYYLVMLAPAVAALVGAGVAALWNDYRGPRRRGWLLPLMLLGMAALHAYILADYEGWNRWLTPVVVGLCLIAAVGLVVLRLRPRLKGGAYPAVAAAVGVLALLVAPLVWSAYTTWYGTETRSPAGGPQPQEASSGMHSETGEPDPTLVDYLQANRGNAEYLVAATNAFSAAPIILKTDDPVISIGGFMGRDPVLSTDKLADLVNKGAVRFFLLSDREGMTPNGGASSQQSDQQGAPQGTSGWGGFSQNESVSWVQDNCERVPQELWQSASTSDHQGGGPWMMRAQALYDCGAKGR